MSKKYHIRWQERDNVELSRAVKNFNAKIDRVAKKNPELKNALPEKMSTKHLKSLINTRQDLKREINALKRFTDKENKIGYDKDGNLIGVETYGNYNIKVTNWQRKEINRRIGVINRRRKERLTALEETEVKSRGKAQGYTRGQFGVGRAERLELAAMEGLTPGMNQTSLFKKWDAVLRESQSDFFTLKDYRTKDNYIKGLYDNFAEADVKDIIEKIDNMPLDEFLKTFHSDQDAKFEGLYAPNNREYKKYVNSLKGVWLPNR